MNNEFAASYTAYRVRSAKGSDSSIAKSTVFSKLHGGNSSNTDAILDSGYTFPVKTTAVTREMKAEIIPLKEGLNIVESMEKYWLLSAPARCS